MPSYRAERSHTRRHLSEYTHVEGELPFISYNDLLDCLEDMVVDVCARIIKDHGDLLKSLNPKFVNFFLICFFEKERSDHDNADSIALFFTISLNYKTQEAPKKPFVRLNHEDAIRYCNEHNIYKDEETKEKFKFGDDITEKPERQMTDQIGKPIFLMRFPAEIKSFYMSRDKERPDLTESVDLLMPNVGEIVGGSMREWSYEKLTNGFKSHGIDPVHYYWYNDLRKYGTFEHGGFGLGLERFLWLILFIPQMRKKKELSYAIIIFHLHKKLANFCLGPEPLVLTVCKLQFFFYNLHLCDYYHDLFYFLFLNIFFHNFVS
ncbi:asparaginyl-tRNA synthetase, cytoplasmic isoform 2 [Reticulomyxa filosa]|uniref:asparagine--tRNA ligase n=1 Tax=Reticulomyxa filosa TaxID=46433 RepID=X6P828_RETFI|nr:asparaginyl-tRNA synthetase, cytoplasmic isoform 2 [Reticulomyxa filosa]|eukprot:ETO34268.1 asparaginyl-tRNA synthetase, cytoplasmic isoform 2 [Reticulomyxa filosa]